MTTVLITGANRGLGLAHAILFAQRGFSVHACARAPGESEALTELKDAHDGRVVVHAFDARDPTSADRLGAELAGEPLDIVLNNAGVMGPRGRAQSLEAITAEAMTDTFEVNVVGPVLLARALVDNVAASGRKIIANQSSLMGSIADNGSGGYYAYRASKAALNAATMSLARDLAGRGICVLALHPGWVRTDMGGPDASLEVSEAAAMQQAVLDQASLADSGKFLNYRGNELAW